MRLWHKDLIHVLPTKQLLAQWRECCAIVGNIEKYGKPNHILVNPIMNYNKSHFYLYCCIVCKEMLDRGFEVSETSRNKILSYVSDEEVQISSRIEKDKTLFEGWHNERYLIQCYYNLEEKYDRGGIDELDFVAIFSKVNMLTNGKVDG